MNKYKIPILSGISEEILDNIRYKVKRYSKKQTLHESGDECLSIDIIISGRVVTYTLSSTGNETAVFEFVKGSMIGGNLLFGTNNKYPMNIYCVEDCEILSIDRETIEYLIRSDADFAMRFIRMLSHNSQGMNRKIVMYTQKNLRQNILEYLHALKAKGGSSDIVLPMTKKQMADYFGVQRPSLFRELKKMREEGIIEIDNRNIRLLK